MEPDFLSLADVLELHRSRIEKYGGSHGVRDMGLLDSALAAPRATFGGAYLHEDIISMAAAYLYHIVMNHPFIDGNKRTGLAAAIAFLNLNGYDLVADPDELTDMVLATAEGKTDKDSIAEFLRANTRKQ
jgi:death-on-curing protein